MTTQNPFLSVRRILVAIALLAVLPTVASPCLSQEGAGAVEPSGLVERRRRRLFCPEHAPDAASGASAVLPGVYAAV